MGPHEITNDDFDDKPKQSDSSVGYTAVQYHRYSLTIIM